MKRQLQVLLVDDSPADALLFQRLCRQIPSQDWVFTHADSYAAGCAALESARFDLYLFDYRLGAHDGLELIEEVQKLDRSEPVILMTGLDDESIGETALIAGATDFLSKHSLSPELIERTVRYAFVRRAVEVKLQERAREDSLTRCFNRAHFMRLAATELARSHRFGHQLALLLLDVDHFKQVNDAHGHPAGDRLLRAVVAASRSTLRASDLIGRYGGDEFIFLLPQTDIAGARRLAERIREAVHEIRLDLGSATLVSTVSIGLAAGCPTLAAGIDSLIESADAGLYSAKERGRNCVAVAI